ncbi:MAG: hypothetical protein Q7J29_14325 [Stagnimonas sp.]|nr:hypothetical protein [Stagnimonas sp.]
MPLDPPKALPATAPAMRPKGFEQRFKPAFTLPPLVPVQQISRPLSTPEYYHASVATSGRTLEVTRENGFCYEGDGQLPAEQWQRALDAVTLINPGTRLRLVGSGRKARWESDGLPPRLRVVENCAWDGRGTGGSEVLYEVPFPLDTGPTVELVVIHRPGNRSLLVLRNHHAVMDGMGCMHFMQELFRALRGEPLLGTNAAFSEVDLMRSVGAKKSTSKHVKTVSMTGLPQGDERGDEWRRISLGKPKKNQLARVADAVAEFARQHTGLQLSIGVPVDLRRHAPGLNSTANFTNMILVTLNPGEGGEVFRTRLKEMLDHKMETVYPGILDLFKWFSLARLDLMLSRKEGNYRTKKALETAVISNLGRHEAAPLSCEGFIMQHFFVIPIKGSIFFGMCCMNDQVELTLNLPRVLASNGRFDAFEAHLLQRMQD